MIHGHFIYLNAWWSTDKLSVMFFFFCAYRNLIKCHFHGIYLPTLALCQLAYSYEVEAIFNLLLSWWRCSVGASRRPMGDVYTRNMSSGFMTTVECHCSIFGLCAWARWTLWNVHERDGLLETDANSNRTLWNWCELKHALGELIDIFL